MRTIPFHSPVRHHRGRRWMSAALLVVAAGALGIAGMTSAAAAR